GRRELDRHLSVHDRPGAGRHDRALSGAEAAAGGARGAGAPRVHRAAHRTDDELPAQRRPSTDAVKKVRILALVHQHLVPPDDTTGIDAPPAQWKKKVTSIQKPSERGHEGGA